MRVLVLVLAVSLAACQSGASVGAGCTGNAGCAAPLVCSFGRCRTECAAQRDCPLGATCRLDRDGSGSCALIDDPDCATAGCPVPLACVGRECVNVCTIGVECPGGSACVPLGDGRARCVRTDGVDAGLPVDDGGPQADTGPRRDAGLCTPMGSPAGPCDTALDVAVSDGVSCVRTTAGRIWCWGASRVLGRGMDTTGCSTLSPEEYACPTPAPLRVDDGLGGTPITDVHQLDLFDVGGCYVLQSTGAIACWGTIDYEAPLGGNPGTGELARPIVGSSLPIFDRVVLTDGSALALAHDRTTWWGWGRNAGDELLLGSTTPMRTPFALAMHPSVRFDTLTTGPAHACAIDAMGAVWCWGQNDHGQADPTRIGTSPTPPVAIGGVTHATELVLGPSHSCALAAEGLVCWGWRENLELDVDLPTCATTDLDCPPTPLPISGFTIEHLVPARNTDGLCAIDHAGALACWGASYGGGPRTPTVIDAVGPVASASLAWTHACAISTDSDVWCWGLNEAGELGRGSVDPSGVGAREPMLVTFP